MTTDDFVVLPGLVREVVRRDYIDHQSIHSADFYTNSKVVAQVDTMDGQSLDVDITGMAPDFLVPGERLTITIKKEAE